ncbi:hypothetical protein [Roseibacillus persicicus]|uniref:hypothetical protein n=1 Tax=Roseibacillus persicicus TaxID=454148 RepID=UPI00280F2AC5|nr:hypothetical protein [Roseibacillus persicicus]MDQ8191445.1 hypothetical protein [Roseibacillus persicicus]
MALLLDDRIGAGLYVPDRQSSLFLGFSILAGSCLLGLSLCSKGSERALHRTYCRVAAELEKGPLTRTELGQAIGSESTQVSSNSPDNSTVSFQQCFSVKESALLDRMIYEGKVIERNEKLSLPS